MRSDARPSPLTGDMHKYFVIILILLFLTCSFGAQISPDDDKGVPACIEISVQF